MPFWRNTGSTTPRCGRWPGSSVARTPTPGIWRRSPPVSTRSPPASGRSRRTTTTTCGSSSRRTTRCTPTARVGSVAAPPEVIAVFAAKTARTFCYGFLGIVLPVYLGELGVGPLGVGTAVTLTLAASAALTWMVRRPAERYGARVALLGLVVLTALSALMLLVSRSPWVVVAAAMLGNVAARPRGPLTSTPLIRRMAALFALDSFAGGFVLQSLVAYFLHVRFGLDLAALGLIFFVAQLLTAASLLLAARCAARFGLLATMVVSHLASNVFLIAIAAAPSGAVAVALPLLPQLLSQLGVSTPPAYLLAVVQDHQRGAAARPTH